MTATRRPNPSADQDARASQPKLRLAIVIGTRAQMVKMAPVMRGLQERGIPYWFLHSGQHRETFDDLRRDFGVKPPDLEAVDSTGDAKTLIRFSGWSLQAMTALRRRRRLLPFTDGYVLIHGDTASTLWGAALARLTNNRVVHVESGLRSFNLLDPFPEELFRLLTFRLTDVYACPDATAANNLARHSGERLTLGGNTLYDSLGIALAADVAPELPIPQGRFGIVSIHRFETLYSRSRLDAVVEGITRAARRSPMLVIAHPPLVHRLRQRNHLEVLQHADDVHVIPRMSYFPFITLLRRSAFVITDGGSNQEELAYLGKPTLVLRSATERQEGLGRNAVMAPVKASSIESFPDQAQQLQAPPLRYAHSPSERLVTWLNQQLSEPPGT